MKKCGQFISNHRRLSLLQSLFVIAFLFAVSYVIHKDVITEYPKGVHRWSQSDHYAIALGYAENNLNLLKPQTYLLNPPISTPEVDTLQGITRVDFPIYHYIVGATMKTTSCPSPFIQRFISLLISLIGLFFLYRLVYQQTRSFWSAFIGVFFVMGLPVYLYYQCNFLPSVPGISLCLIGYYFYFKYLEKEKHKNFILSILFFGFATLFRLPLAISLVAIACQQTLGYIIKRKIEWKEILIFFTTFLLIGLYYVYNSYIGNKYGSIFLSDILPPSSFADFKEWLSIIHDHQYDIHTNDRIRIFVSVLLVNTFAYLVYSLIKKQPITKFQQRIILQAGIALLGGFIYFVLMIKQYKYHDYYFIDTFYTAVTLLIVFCITFIKWDWKIVNTLIKVFLLVLLCFMIDKSNKSQKQRLEFTPSQNEYYVDEYIDDIQYLMEKHSIDENKTVYIMDDQMQANVAFCKLRQKGFCWNGFDQNQRWLSKADYIFSSKKSLVNTLFKYDYTLPFKLETIDEYGTIVMMKRSDGLKTTQLRVIKSENSLDEYNLNFDNIPSPVWVVKDAVVEYDSVWNNVAHITSDREYSSTLSLPMIEMHKKRKMQEILIDIDVYPLENNGNIALVVCVDRNDKLHLYEKVDIDMSDVRNWKQINHLFHYRELDENTDKFSVYLWNYSKSELYYDNFSVKFLK